MEKFLIATGKTIDLAIQAALDQLSMDRDSVSVEVLENAKSGFLGIGAQPAKVKVSYEVPDEEPKPALSSASRSKPKKETAPAAQSAVAPRVIAPAAPKQEQPNVGNVRHVLDPAHAVHQQRGRQNGHGGVLRARDRDSAFQPLSALYDVFYQIKSPLRFYWKHRMQSGEHAVSVGGAADLRFCPKVSICRSPSFSRGNANQRGQFRPPA